jgi:hypothetical protein
MKNDNGSLFKDSIKENLVLELKIGGFSIVDENKWREKERELKLNDNELFDGPVAMKLAEKSDADVAITGFLLLSKKKILFGIKCYDVKAKRLAATVIKNGRPGLSVASLINEAINEIMPKIKKELEMYTITEGEIRKEVTVYEDITLKQFRDMGQIITLTLLSSDEGAVVYMADKNAGTIADGKLSSSISGNANLIIRIEKPGFYDSTQEVKVGDSDSQIRLKPLYKKSFSFAPEISYTVFQFYGLGLGMRYYPVTPWFDLTDWTFFNLNNYLYIQAGSSTNSSMIVHNDINLSINQYVLNDPSSFFRLGVYTGAGVIVTFFTVPNMPVYSDFYIDIFGAWTELNFPDFILYFRLTARAYTPFFNIITNDLLGSGMFKMGPVTSIGVVYKW